LYIIESKEVQFVSIRAKGRP